MYIFVLVVHILACLFLVMSILFQAGKGAGLSNIFGGGGGGVESIFGTKTNVFLSRVTTLCATIFILTCIGLAMMSAHRKTSLMTEGSSKTQQEPSQQQPEAQQPVPAK